jgi:hypothetical protein
MLSAIMMRAIKLSVVMLSIVTIMMRAFKLSVIMYHNDECNILYLMLSAIMMRAFQLSVIMLSVVMLSATFYI